MNQSASELSTSSVMESERRIGGSNQLLAAISPADRAWLEPRIHIARVEAGETLFDMQTTLTTVYFPLTAVVSLLFGTPSGASSAIGLVGPEGMVGVDCALGAARSSSRAVVCQAGTVACVPAAMITNRMDASPTTRRVLLGYAHAFYTEASQSALCCQQHHLEQRFCHRLLLISDRAMSTEVRLSHEKLAEMLGVRREGVTDVAGRLRRLGLIDYRRGRLTIVDRAGLERHACECYAGAKRPLRSIATTRPAPLRSDRPSRRESGVVVDAFA